MIGILLAILKWIGILLLAILGLVLAILLIVLLVPIRYRLQGARSPQEGKLTASGKVGWLLSILAVTFSYDQEFSWRIRICGIPLKKKEGQPEDDMEDLTEEQLAQIAELEEELAEEATKIPKVDLRLESKKNPKMDPETDLKTDPKADFAKGPKGRAVVKPSHNVESGPQLQTQKMKDTEDNPTESDHTESEPTEEKVPFSEKLRGTWQKISETVRSIPAKIAGIQEKIRSLKEKADIWIAFAKSDEVKQLLTVCKKQLRQILRHLIPTSLKIRGNYGFEDPSLTGKITGVICALPPKLQKGIHVQPHFQEECLDGEFVLTGRIRLGSLLWPCILIVVRPCTWKVFKRYRAITNPKPADNGVKSSKKGRKGAKTKKKSGKTGGSHKKKEKNIKNDPHKGGKQ